jgi:hypothetical protein
MQSISFGPGTALWKQIGQNVTANQIPSANYALTLVPAEVMKWSLKGKKNLTLPLSSIIAVNTPNTP